MQGVSSLYSYYYYHYTSLLPLFGNVSKAQQGEKKASVGGKVLGGVGWLRLSSVKADGGNPPSQTSGMQQASVRHPTLKKVININIILSIGLLKS